MHRLLTPYIAEIPVDVDGGTYRCDGESVDCLKDAGPWTEIIDLSGMIAAHPWTYNDGSGASPQPTYVAIHMYLPLGMGDYDGPCDGVSACGPSHPADGTLTMSHGFFDAPVDSPGSGGTPGYPWLYDRRIFGLSVITNLRRDMSDGGHLGDPAVFTPDELGFLSFLMVLGEAHFYSGSIQLFIYGWIPLEDQGHIMAGAQTRGVRSRGRVVGHSESAG